MSKLSAPIIASQSTFELDSTVFSTKLSAIALAQVIRVYQNNAHQDTKKTKHRGEVSGTSRKVYSQKGTGNARHGSTKAPVYVGGGVAHGPTGVKPAAMHLPQQLRSQALATVLTSKLSDKSLSILETTKLEEPSTKAISSLFASAALLGKAVTLVYDAVDPANLGLSARNIARLALTTSSDLNALSASHCDAIIFTPAAITALQTRLLPFLTKNAK